ncbi:glucokinase [Stenotrophomonas sp.]|uniref:glucokinase n=1 Tax=Stenotrophomonas sp. TaxID=69392 RepID=UPI0028AC89C2|nr:glucokinase [Stenotrophomonas sp.]
MSSAPAPRPGLHGDTLIVADVGGTYARLALADVSAGQPPRISALRRYACAEFPSLAAILAGFSATLATPPSTAVVAIAGLLEGDHLVNTNLPWDVSVDATRRDAQLATLELINDFEAVAYAIPHVAPDTLVAMNGDTRGDGRWPALVLGPGTGLGGALRFEAGSRAVLASEAGHAALGAGTALELQVLAQMLQRWEHVDNERILSGSGLMNLYPSLCAIRGVTPRWSSPEALIAAAHAGDDALAVETLEVFCGWLGSLAGDLAVTFGARSVYLAGGISSHVARFLDDGHFRTRFLAKGVMRRVLEQVPVWRVEHGELGVIGAAVWYAEHRRAAA